MGIPNNELAVHPIVTLSIVDHYSRVSKDSNKRVVGILLGYFIDGIIHATNSYAIPFEEDSKKPTLWYLDHIYLESMADMFNKISKTEKIIGWYSTGQKLKSSDLQIDQMLQKYVTHPIYLLVNLGGTIKHQDPLFQAYVTYDKPCNNRKFSRVFTHICCSIAQFEAEEVAVEHLLRDLKVHFYLSQTAKIFEKIGSLKSFCNEILVVKEYLEKVVNGKLPINYSIINNVQEIINCSPNIHNDAFIKCLEIKTNESYLSLHAGSLIRTVMALHDLLKNQIHLSANKPISQQSHIKL